MKTKVHLSYILHVISYDVDCITWNKRISKKNEVFQNHILHIITSHRHIDKIKITTLRDLTKIPILFDKIKSKTLKLYGHIKRSKTGLSKLCLEGLITGKINKGEPKYRWRDM